MIRKKEEDFTPNYIYTNIYKYIDPIYIYISYCTSMLQVQQYCYIFDIIHFHVTHIRSHISKLRDV